MAGFTQNFKRQNQDNGFLPQSIVNKMNEKWNEELEYFFNGVEYVLRTSKKELNIKIVNFEIENLEAIERKCGKSHMTMNDILAYSYNSQNPINLILNENFKQYFNGQEVALNEMIKLENEYVDFSDGRIILIPKKMNNILTFEVGNGNEKYSYEFIQKPIESINKMYFVSSSDSKILIEFTVEGSNIKFNMRLNHKSLDSADEYLEILKFMQSLFDNGLYFDDYQVTIPGIKDENYDSRKELIDIWTKIVTLQDLLDVKFSIDNDIIASQDLFYIDTLYKSLKHEIPLSIPHTLKTIVYDEDELASETINELKKSKKRSYFLEFADEKELTILNTPFKVYELRTIFNIYISEVEKDEEQNKIILTLEENEKNRMFCSLRYFNKPEELVTFQNDESHVSIMHDAQRSMFFNN